MFILWSMLGGCVYLVVHVRRLCLSCGPFGRPGLTALAAARTVNPKVDCSHTRDCLTSGDRHQRRLLRVRSAYNYYAEVYINHIMFISCSV